MKIMLDTKTQITMKKIINKVSVLLLSMIVLSSCNKNDNDENIYEGESFVSFNATTSGSISESASSPLTVKVYASVPAAQAESFTLDFTVASSDAVAGTDYSVVGTKTSLSFGPDQYEDTIQIMPIDNSNPEANKTITITLGTASNGLTVGLPGPDNKANSFVVTLIEDDCPLTDKLFSGKSSGTETSSASAGEKPSEATFTVTAQTATTVTYKIEGILAPQFTRWNENITSGGELSITLDMTDPSKPKIIPIDGGDPLSNGLAFFYAQTDNEWGYYLKLDNAKSNFSTCANSIKLSFSIDITQASTGRTFLDDITTVLDLKF